MTKLFITILSSLFFTFSAHAEDIKITADQKVEWHQNEQKMIAVGNAVASKKDLKIRGHELTAYYIKDKSGKQQINEVHANGDVIMNSAKATAYGDRMDYDLLNDKAFLYGRPAKIKTETETITAVDGITYYPSKQKAVAEGNVYATNGESKIYSDNMIAHFEKDKNNTMVMKIVKVFGHVKIVTKDGTVWADRGTYLPQTGMVKLYDNITIDQQGNKLHGDFAETNLKTGISRILAGKTSKNRVSGVFIEKSDKSDKPASTKDKTSSQEPQQ